MASNSQNDKAADRAMFEAEESVSLFGDAMSGVPVDITVKEKDRFAKARKNHLLFILMVMSPGFPLRVGQELYVNVKESKLPGSTTKIGVATVLEDCTLMTDEGPKLSLDKAEAVYHGPDRKVDKHGNTKSNGWTRWMVQKPDLGYESLSDLVVSHFQDFEVPLDTITDRNTLALYLQAREWMPEPYRKSIETAAKKKATPPKNAKLDSDDTKNGVEVQ